MIDSTIKKMEKPEEVAKIRPQKIMMQPEIKTPQVS
jgi:hypothetical protein